MSIYRLQSIVIVASGPSVSQDQIDLILQHRDILSCMVVNDNYRLIPTADHLFAADLKWWYHHYDKVPMDIECWSLEGHPEHLDRRIPGAKDRIKSVSFTRDFGLYYDKVHHGGNSGYIAVQLARLIGYSRILLVGFDHKHTNGKRHWFGDHDPKIFNKNADDVDLWVNAFDRLAPLLLLDTEVINCSNETALECFPRSSLETEIEQLKSIS